MDFNQKDIDAIAADVAALRRDLAKAMERFKDTSMESALEHAQEMADEVTDDLAGVYKDYAKRGKRAARNVGKQIEDQPITSMLIAFSMGYIASKLFSR